MMFHERLSKTFTVVIRSSIGTPILVLIAVCLTSFCQVKVYAGSDPFIVKPYLQIGDPPHLSVPESLVLMWHAEDRNLEWSVEVRDRNADVWSPIEQVSHRRIAVPTIEPHRVYSAVLAPLKPGTEFEYRIREGNRPAFSSHGRARKSAGQVCRIAVLADIARDTLGQRGVAYHMYQAKPDLVVIPGDIVYDSGRIAEYRKHFYPIYNADAASPEEGAPLMRSIPFIAAPGSHDIQEQNLYWEVPDGFAYYMYWSLPMNGPDLKLGDHNTVQFRGGLERRRDLLEAIQPNFPRMSTYSLDFGDTHWTMLDTNDQVDWKDPVMRDWLRNDLKSAEDSVWRFVGCYSPGFQSGRSHLNMQKMRIAADLFEEGDADIVFHGCNHDYERTVPLLFRVTRTSEGKIKVRNQAVVEGEYTLDKTFDGRTDTTPEGVIYVTTGAGGASLQNPQQTGDPDSWEPFTATFIGDKYSFTLLDITEKRVVYRQISEYGEELDRIVIDK